MAWRAMSPWRGTPSSRQEHSPCHGHPCTPSICGRESPYAHKRPLQVFRMPERLGYRAIMRLSYQGQIRGLGPMEHP